MSSASVQHSFLFCSHSCSDFIHPLFLRSTLFYFTLFLTPSIPPSSSPPLLYPLLHSLRFTLLFTSVPQLFHPISHSLYSNPFFASSLTPTSLFSPFHPLLRLIYFTLFLTPFIQPSFHLISFLASYVPPSFSPPLIYLFLTSSNPPHPQLL
jgi:hypothetical protein